MSFNGYHIGQRDFAVTVLADGRILATGGADGDDGTGVPDVGWDLWTWNDPAITSISGSLPAARTRHSQASLAADSAIPGGALVTGGWTSIGTALATVLSFDAGTHVWTVMAPMARARYGHQSVALDGDRVLVVGGRNTGGYFSACEIYDVDADTWSPTGNMTYSRDMFALVALPDGRFLAVGGWGYNKTQTLVPSQLASCEVYDPATGLWSVIPPMRTARAMPVAEYQESRNCVVVAGGSTATATVEILDLATMRWRTSPHALSSPLSSPTGGLASDDTFLVAGGFDADDETVMSNFVGILGDDSVWLGAGINSHRGVVESASATTFTYQTREYEELRHTYTVARERENGTFGSVTVSAALEGQEGVPGPYSYDVQTGLAIVEANAVTDQAFNRGEHYASLHLDTDTNPAPALDFPDEEGYLVFNFGFKNQVGPIKYLGRLSDEDLLLDASVAFSATLPTGATVRLLSGRVPFEPESDDLVGSFYVTGTAAGRVAAQRTIDAIVAAGKQILVTVLYPGDRGLGAAGFPTSGAPKLSDKVGVWGGDELDEEIPAAREGNL